MDPGIHVLDGDPDTLRKRAIFAGGAFLGPMYSIGKAVDDRLKSLRDSDKRPGNTNHGVVDLVVVQYSGPGNTNHRVVDLVVVQYSWTRQYEPSCRRPRGRSVLMDAAIRTMVS